MTKTNAERQRLYIARLKARAAAASQGLVSNGTAEDGCTVNQAVVSNEINVEAALEELGRLPSDMPGGADIVSNGFCRWFEAAIIEGRMSPWVISLIGSNLQQMGKVYWGRNGKRYPRKKRSLS